jgi:predicted membrane GTPase involved in stress response
VAVGEKVKVLQYETGQVIEQLKITKIEKKAGLGKVQLQSAFAGDVVSIAGPGDAAGIADTIAAPAVAQALDPGPIDPPTLRWAAPLVHAACSYLWVANNQTVTMVQGGHGMSALQSMRVHGAR